MHADDAIHVLAVDDNPGKRLALSTVLSELPVDVVTADSGREALRLLLQQEFAVILLDVHMPGMDGFETASLIRQRKNTEHTPIIFVTSYPDDTHAARGYSLGAVDYILAPVDPEVLKTKVMVFVELFRKTAQVKLQADALERRARAAPSPDAGLARHQLRPLASTRCSRSSRTSRATSWTSSRPSAVAAPDQKWSAPRTAVSLSAGARGGRAPGPCATGRTCCGCFLGERGPARAGGRLARRLGRTSSPAEAAARPAGSRRP